MMLHRISNYIIVLLMICFSIFTGPSPSLAKVENDSKQQAFLNFENRIFNLINSSMEPLDQLDKLDGKTDEESLYNIVLMAKEGFTKNSLLLGELKVSIVLPNDIKASLENVRDELSKGFKEMEESMDYLAQYIVNRNPNLYNKYIAKQKKGLLHIDGGITLLTLVGLRLSAPKRPIPDAWQVNKDHLYQLEKKIQ